MNVILLDVRGERCPEPVVKLAKLLEREIKSHNSVIIRVLTDNEDCVKYMKDLLVSVGIVDYSISKLKDHYELKIRVTSLSS